ncbi:hypothetical protein Z043_125740, partial [Scleropages formosus]
THSVTSDVNLWKSQWGGDFWPSLESERSAGISCLKSTFEELLMNKVDVMDIWREKFLNDRLYTWSYRDGSLQSSIDFWLVSKAIDKNSITVNILTTLLTVEHLAAEVISEITTLSSLPPGSSSEEERLRLTELQSKLDGMYRARAEGAFIRSQQKWLENGEQMSTFFFKPEKSQT